MTTAKRTGVSRGTMIWRGVRAVSAARRWASVVRAATVCMSCHLRQPVAGEAQVDVVEGRRARGERRDGQAGARDRGERLVGGARPQRDGDRRADRDGVAERGGRARGVAVDAQLEDL